VGSTIAEAAVRIGFSRLTLADADIVELHNLNRQTYVTGDIGRKKVAALAGRLEAINPVVEINEFDGLVAEETVSALVGGADLALDTIDFLDISGIVALHDECRRQGKPVVSCASAGWGAVATYFPADGDVTFRELFGLPRSGSVAGYSYVTCFETFVERLRGVMMPDVVEAVSRALTEMEDDRPCPAPHLSVGASAAAALGVTMLVSILAGRPVTEAPRMVVADFNSLITGEGIDLTP
jgi:molybdopterin/thiamine biosynthesis adenylyltransferase